MGLAEEPEVVRVPSVAGFAQRSKTAQDVGVKFCVFSSTCTSVLALNESQNHTWVSPQRKLVWC